MDIAMERSYPTPFSNSPLLPMLLMSLASQKHSPNIATTFKDEYDYIVVGAGSAGSVVASRLSEKPCVTVLLLEAGKAPPQLTDVPVIGRSYWFSDIDWAYRTAPQRHTGNGLVNRQVVWPSGKTLGGSSVLNAVLYVRGNKQNYDDWAKQGAEGWSYKDVLPYFKKMENNQNSEYVDSGYHGDKGPVTVEKPRYMPPLKEAIMKGVEKLGYSFVDPNGANQTGIYDIQGTIRGGQRCSTAKAYLVPAENRTNLDILPKAMVRKVLIKHFKAVGVEFDFEHVTYKVKARKEVIVCAGTVNTAQLLMLSGIGPERELIKHKIPCLIDLPVGRNFQDHPTSNVNFAVYSPVQSIEAKFADPANTERYISSRTGIMTSTELAVIMAFLGSKPSMNPAKSRSFPKYQLYIGEFSPAIVKQDFGLTPGVFQQVYGPYVNKTIFTCFSSLLQPKSRGTVTLRSSNPYDAPIIDPNYLSDPSDIDGLVEGMKECFRICTSRPVKEMLKAEPFATRYPGCEKLDNVTAAYFACQVKSALFTLSHQVGTAKMGRLRDSSTVVDPELKVKGIQGLRVVDASVMPIVPSGNTNVPTIMVAEKASDIIKKTIHCDTNDYVTQEMYK